MSKKLFTVTALLIIIVGILVFGLNSRTSQDLVNPSETPSPVPTPDTPKTFKFDNSTDLKAELENINPQVLEEDFYE